MTSTPPYRAPYTRFPTDTPPKSYELFLVWPEPLDLDFLLWRVIYREAVFFGVLHRAWVLQRNSAKNALQVHKRKRTNYEQGSGDRRPHKRSRSIDSETPSLCSSPTISDVSLPEMEEQHQDWPVIDSTEWVPRQRELSGPYTSTKDFVLFA